jgi:hypothetical protein
MILSDTHTIRHPSSHRLLALVLMGLCGALWPLSPAAVPLQESSCDITTLAPGVRLWQVAYSRQNYRQRIYVIELQGEWKSHTIEAVMGSGLWGGEGLDRILRRESAVAAWQALEQPPYGSQSAWPGLTVSRHCLMAAPGNGPVLAVTPEGFFDLLDSTAETTRPLGMLTIGTEREAHWRGLPITWLNRAPRPGTFGLLADPGLLRESLLAEARSPQFVEMQFRPKEPYIWTSGGGGGTGAALTPWTSCRAGTFTWISEPMFTAGERADFDSGWMGLAAIDPPETDLSLLSEFFVSRSSGALTLHTQPEWNQYRAVIPLGNWLVRGGKSMIAPDPPGIIPETRRARSAVALHREHRRLWLVYVWSGQRDADGMSEAELAQFLIALGAADAAQGPEGNAAAAVARDHAILPPGHTPARARLALAVVPVEATSGARNLARTAPPAVSGSRPLTPENGADRVVDDRQGVLATLDHFWASEGDAARPPTLEFDLQRECRIEQMDLVHAQAAGFSPEFNARSVRILARAGGRDRWIEVLHLVNETPPGPRQPIQFTPPVVCRYLRLEFTEANFVPSSRVARMVEVVFWGSTGK